MLIPLFSLTSEKSTELWASSLQQKIFKVYVLLLPSDLIENGQVRLKKKKMGDTFTEISACFCTRREIDFSKYSKDNSMVKSRYFVYEV